MSAFLSTFLSRTGLQYALVRKDRCLAVISSWSSNNHNISFPDGLFEGEQVESAYLFQSRKRGQCHHIMKVSRSSPSSSWPSWIVTIAEVHEFFHRWKSNCQRHARDTSRFTLIIVLRSNKPINWWGKLSIYSADIIYSQHRKSRSPFASHIH